MPVYASVYTVSRITVTDCMFYYVPAQQDGLQDDSYIVVCFCGCVAVCLYAPMPVFLRVVLVGCNLLVCECSFCSFCLCTCALECICAYMPAA